MSLIPDRQLTFSPDLATTIGLEEAILLQGLSRYPQQDPYPANNTLLDLLQDEFPFWTRPHIEGLLHRLAELGIIAPAEHHPRDAGNRTPPERSQVHTEQPSIPITPWRPSEDLMALLALNHGIDRAFVQSHLTTFAPPQGVDNPDTQFRQHVLAAWRREQRQHQAFEVKAPPAFDQNWQPSEDAIEIMARGGIDPEFIDSVRPEFILYWRERGGPPREVNSKFIGWIRQRWVRFQAGLGHSTEPKPMTPDWQPSDQVYEVLALSGIERDFACDLLGEFRVFWCETGELQTSWSSKFLQHVKHQWRWQMGQTIRGGGNHGGQQRSGGTGGGDRTRDRSLAQDLTDTSWAQ